MGISSTRARSAAAPDRAPLPVFDTCAGGKRLVTAIIESPEFDPSLARQAREIRGAAVAHQRSLGRGSTVHLVQVFDERGPQSRVEDMLAQAQPGALVVFFGRTAAECRSLMQALGIALTVAPSLALH